MSINPYNHEHYYDPTVCEALTHIEQEARKTHFRPMIFICSPFAGDVEGNVQRTCEYCRFAVSSNCIPFAPHLLFPQFLDDSDMEQRSLGLFMGMVFMSKCREVWVFGSKITKGMSIEIMKAQRRGLPIRYFTEQFEEVVVHAQQVK